jgi:hypothetical protein
VTQPDWAGWQRLYAVPGGALAQRLAIIQRLVRGFLAERGGDELRIVSMCAGQGRDLLPTLAEHPRGRMIAARLVELDPTNTTEAGRVARETGLERVEVVTGDASLTDAYVRAVPADLVLACGNFGNTPTTTCAGPLPRCRSSAPETRP